MDLFRKDTVFVFKAYSIAKQGLFIDDVLYNYHIYNDSVSRAYMNDVLENQTIVIKELCDTIRENGKYNFYEFNNNLNVAICSFFMVCIQVNFCHKDNPRKYSIRKKEFLVTKEIDYYSGAISNADMAMCRFSERMLQKLIRYELFFLINILFKSRQFFISLFTMETT